MADSADKVTKAPDPLPAAIQPNDQDESAGGPYIIQIGQGDGSKRDDDDGVGESSEEEVKIENPENPEEPEQPPHTTLGVTQSHATHLSGAASALSRTTSETKPWYKTPNPLRWGAIPPVPAERSVSREHTAGFFSLLVFQWMAPLMSVGYKRQLEHNDIWTVNPDRAAEKLTLKLKKSFQKRVDRGDKHPLLWAMHETFFFEFWLGGILQVMATIFQVMSPFILRYLIQFANDAWDAAIAGTSAPQIGQGIGLVLGVTAMQILQSLGVNHFIYRGMMVGGQTRAVLISFVFEKSMSISGRAKAGGAKEVDSSEHDSSATEGDEGSEEEKAGEKNKEEKKKDQKKESEEGKKGNGKRPTKSDAAPGISGDGAGWGNGRIINLMSVDTYRIDQASALFHMVWSGPLAILITLAVLIVNLGYSALAGFALLAVGVPLLARAIRSLFRRRKAINKITDQRVSLTQEVLSSVRFVKYFGWESAFLDRLKAIRKREIHSIQSLLAIRNAINAVSMSMPIFASMLAFITYSLTDHTMRPAEIFSSLALFNGLRMPLNLLPLVLGQVVDAWSSIKRIQEFLLAEEREEDVTRKPSGENALELHGASFTWERTPTTKESEKGKGKGSKPGNDGTQAAKGAARPPSSSGGDASSRSTVWADEREPFKLQQLELAVARNELVAVIGTVGCGKSSLLAALAGDMRKTSGEVVLGGSRAFCPQYAWIRNATVRDNILFGKEMDRDWYNQVIDACALRPDFEMLPNGDATEIGEKGITISGGQKQRLNIARAIYYNADIVLMDDPLSAVDAHVGRHIFDRAILGLLKDKCRILATHQLWVLNRCDRIVWMEGGQIVAVDTFDNLMSNSESFQHLMETTAVEEKRDEGPVAETNESGVVEEKKRKGGGALMQQEERAVSSVPWSVYSAYIRASGTVLSAPLVILFLVIALGANMMTGLWLSYWTSDHFGMATGGYIGVYAALGFAQAFLMFCFSVMLSIFGTNASRVMLRRAVTRVLRAPMSFFDTTPLGRITNRFSRDVDIMDNNLTDAFRMYFLTLGMILSVFALVIAFFHWFALALVPLSVLFIFAAAYYRSSAREIKRFESVLRSTVFAKFSEGLSGTASIRAYGLKDHFITDLRTAIDKMNAAYYLTFSNQRWLSVRLDLVGNLLVFTVGILVVTSRFSVPPSTGGLVLSYILATVQMIQFTVRQLAEVENGMNAVERLQYYGTQLEEEAPVHTIEVRPSWPEKGEIIFDDVQMRYRANLPLVLQGFTLHVAGGERIGIVGRTGAGKSSIMSTLFRLVEVSGGRIVIDGVDISTIGLHDLRSRLAIIPQDPTLFRGTIRSNLDPFNEHTDLELWSALRQADLVPAGANLTADPLSNEASSRLHLDSAVEEDGLNFSLGQRQLMALARALVRGSRIIVCDEATSSVDMETDDKIQNTIATGFRGRTLLCIAHRLRTIIGYDRICVMDAGRIAELGTPLELWHREGGIFRGMCDRSLIRAEDIVRSAETTGAGRPSPEASSDIEGKGT
ncbi:ATP-binding cassette transporter protein [Sodiomyces alkalinus F11]|uniref:ATP-binding cassette transporter protein n=1 Tax=Sodiomyces alkalinus (strain CBS 110278 / VKM F-3762 / F11) TaxID=1314773 RepID=A0A3N2Q8W7_SODAK|nr:ATP-binding cassette transporter protein [Sodiomyces alkalinus F11]ROT43088.1 ATP-binding cassette transporter protein [Sodiomyces alkalinus F11]